MARRSIRSTPRALALVVCGLLLLSGCNRAETPDLATQPTAGQPDSPATATSDAPRTPGDRSGNGSGNGDGNGDGNGNQAAGSPIDVPTVPSKNLPMDQVSHDSIEQEFVKACGGHDLCVTLVFGDGACFAGYDPAPTAPRGSTVHVLTESQQECDHALGLDGSQEPISIPTIPARHLPMDQVSGSAIEDLFVAACGGQALCVKLVYGDGACFAGYDPAVTAQRGSTVRVLTESQAECDQAIGSDGSGSTSGGGAADGGQADGSG